MLALAVAGLLQVGVPAAAPDSLTLADALNRARRGRGQTVVAAARAGAARGALRAAGNVSNPLLSYTRTESTPRQHLTVDQSFDWLLRRGADRRAARAGIDRALADSTQLLAELSRDVRLTFYRARATLTSETLVQAQAALADSLARLASARLAAGDISRFEQEQAAQERARSRQILSEAREHSRVALADLAQAVGWERETLPIPVGALDTTLGHVASTAGVTPDSVPALHVAIADSAAAAATARATARARVPVPALQVGAEWDDDPGSSLHHTINVVGLSIPLPLWQRGGGAAAEAQSRAVETAAQAHEARLDVTRALREARIHLEETADRARFARDSLLPAAHALGARALQAYQSGATGILPVLDAIRGERDVALAAIQDLLAYQEAIATWNALVGRTD